MWKDLACLVVSAVALGGCSHAQREEPLPPVGRLVASTDPAFTKDDPAARYGCKADGDCPQGTLCLPDRHVCFTSYPEPRMLEIDFTGPQGAQCRLVSVYFAFDSDVIIPEAGRWLDYDAGCLKARHPGRVVVYGYADARGDADYNQKLSLRRAEAVKSYLQQHGVSLPIDAAGEGVSRRMPTGNTEENYAFNRRVEVRVE